MYIISHGIISPCFTSSFKEIAVEDVAFVSTDCLNGLP